MIPGLCALALDAVSSGAVLGWDRPGDLHTIETYWRNTFRSLDGRDHVLLIAHEALTLVGTVQLVRGHFETSRHRGEVAKLIVASEKRRRGIGEALMNALEDTSIKTGIELLVLDTRSGEPVEFLYKKMGYHKTGNVPNWMKFSNGTYRDTVFYYKSLRTQK